MASETLTGGTLTGAEGEAVTGGGGVVFVSAADKRASSIIILKCVVVKLLYERIAGSSGFRIF